ncbi:MATE family efflux transporter [Oscillospiraceae bacterium OttesenSCG-928-F05]|nr:MATE family efflux transporter [Oscillospiraceae bacterium OttesenSCG-928-F05]
MPRDVAIDTLDAKGSRRYIVTLAVPVFFELLLQLLVTNVDQFMISAYSPQAVAAIGNANQILSLVTITTMVLTGASLVLISQYRGAKDSAREQLMYPLTLGVNAVIGILVSAVLFFLCGQIFGFMNVEPEVLPHAKHYISIVGGGFFIQAMIIAFSTFLKSNAMMKHTMFISIGINILNVFGNFFLINGYLGAPALGATGAAISTVASRALGLAALIFFYYRHVGVSLRPGRLRPFPLPQLKKLLYIAVPGACEPLSYNMTQIFILSFINAFGLAAVNAFVYISIFIQFASTCPRAVGQAAQVVIGRLCGAGRQEDAQKAGFFAARAAAVVSLAVSALVFCLADPLFALFTSDQTVVAIGKSLLIVDIVRSVARAYNLVIVRTLQTAGDVIVPTIIAVASGWIVSVLGSYTVGVWLAVGLTGIYCMIAADEWVRAVILTVRWKIGGWKARNLLKE